MAFIIVSQIAVSVQCLFSASGSFISDCLDSTGPYNSSCSHKIYKQELNKLSFFLVGLRHHSIISKMVQFGSCPLMKASNFCFKPVDGRVVWRPTSCITAVIKIAKSPRNKLRGNVVTSRIYEPSESIKQQFVYSTPNCKSTSGRCFA